jgi:hypothetical protein
VSNRNICANCCSPALAALAICLRLACDGLPQAKRCCGWRSRGGLVGRSYHRGRVPSARTLRRARLAAPGKIRSRLLLAKLACPDRKSLLFGTALASTLLIASLSAPTPAHAVVNCPPGSGPITIGAIDDIVCINVDDRSNVGSVITLFTNGGGNYIYLNNSGSLTATNVGADAIGIVAFTNGGNSPIDILNSGDVTAAATGG